MSDASIVSEITDELVQDLFLDGRVSGFSPVQITPTVNTNRISCM
jgi:hypothetical protein